MTSHPLLARGTRQDGGLSLISGSPTAGLAQGHRADESRALGPQAPALLLLPPRRETLGEAVWCLGEAPNH